MVESVHTLVARLAVLPVLAVVILSAPTHLAEKHQAARSTLHRAALRRAAVVGGPSDERHDLTTSEGFTEVTAGSHNRVFSSWVMPCKPAQRAGRGHE